MTDFFFNNKNEADTQIYLENKLVVTTRRGKGTGSI